MLENNINVINGYFYIIFIKINKKFQYLKLSNELKPQYINYYKNNYNLYDKDSNIYPPHFNIKYNIDNRRI